MMKEEEYFSFVRHELRNQLGIIREGVSQIIDGLGRGDCSRCNMMLKPVLECSDKLNKLIEELVSVPKFEKMVEPANSSVEAFKRDVMIVIDHEIRTPLAIVQEGLSLVADEIPGALNPKQKELLKNVKDAMARLCIVVEKILLTPAAQLKGEDMALKKKILLVDDDANFLEVVKRRLSEGNYEVITAGSGEEALALVSSGKLDVILMDVMMPGIDGLEVLEKIRKYEKNLPVYIITAFTDDERFKAARSAGASGFIAKTDDLKKALDGITSVINVSGKYKGKA